MGKGKICELRHYVPKFEAFMLNTRNNFSKSSRRNTASNDVTSRLFLNCLNCEIAENFQNSQREMWQR